MTCVIVVSDVIFRKLKYEIGNYNRHSSLRGGRVFYLKKIELCRSLEYVFILYFYILARLYSISYFYRIFKNLHKKLFIGNSFGQSILYPEQKIPVQKKHTLFH